MAVYKYRQGAIADLQVALELFKVQSDRSSYQKVQAWLREATPKSEMKPKARPLEKASDRLCREVSVPLRGNWF